MDSNKILTLIPIRPRSEASEGQRRAEPPFVPAARRASSNNELPRVDLLGARQALQEGRPMPRGSFLDFRV